MSFTSKREDKLAIEAAEPGAAGTSSIKKNLLRLDAIYVPPGVDARIRDGSNLAEAVLSRTRSLIKFGQLQPILVEKLETPIDGKEWKLIDGQVRWVSMLALTTRYAMGELEVIAAFNRWSMEPGHIEITTRNALDELTALMMEFHANEDRDNFTWDEKAKYIRKAHDMLQKKHGRKNWSQEQTAEAIGMSPASVTHYLQLTDERNPAVKSERVLSATTKGAALKQLKIETERQKRTARAQKQNTAAAITPQSQEEEPTEPGSSNVEITKQQADNHLYEEIRVISAAKFAFVNKDCREWIKEFPDSSLDWFHWDPPYGGKEGAGGAFAAHQGIQISHDYALKLIEEMLPEIWRVLHDGSWMAIWFTPVHYNWLRLALQGHRFDDAGVCIHCEKNIITDHVWLSENYSCRPSPYRFWVNPYPNIWRKVDRVADGHEIQRFLTKETEFFFLCGKQDTRTPILLRSNRGNVFDFGSIHSAHRRHVNHKPPHLLKEILSLISVPGALGADAGAGSGSIIEAAFESNRRVLTSELSEMHAADNVAIGLEALKETNVDIVAMAPWIAKFAE